MINDRSELPAELGDTLFFKEGCILLKHFLEC